MHIRDLAQTSFAACTRSIVSKSRHTLQVVENDGYAYLSLVNAGDEAESM